MIPLIQVDEIRKRSHFCATNAQEWETDLVFQPIYQFFTHRSYMLLVVYRAEDMLVVGHSPPSFPVGRIVYFLRTKPELIYPNSTFDEIVHSGVLQRNYLECLVRLMSDLFSPLMAHAAGHWPDSVRNEFAAGMNRFMSTLTDIASKAEHNTVLYVPNENLSSSIQEMLADRDLIQRLETTVIRWTRQVKDILNTSHADDGTHIELPTDELNFWEQRCHDMSGISQQLNKDGVVAILKILEAASSTYVTQFQNWAQRIKDGMEVVRISFCRRFVSIYFCIPFLLYFFAIACICFLFPLHISLLPTP